VSDASQPAQPSENDGAVSRPDRRRWQVGIRTLILITAAIAVWLAFFLNRAHNRTMEVRIKSMQSLAHELLIEDEKKVAVVQADPEWYDQNEWKIYLPKGEYQLCLATRGIEDKGFPAKKESTRLAAGEHYLALEQPHDDTTCRVVIKDRGEAVLTAEEPKEWNPRSGSMGGGQYSQSEQLAANEPVVLFRRRFMGPRGAKGMTSVPKGPTEGILLWIEPVRGAIAKP